jgi:3-oxoacyl-[acyl-carrier protein] reductase
LSRLLAGKNAIVYGGGGAIGGATAKVFAREGARVFLAGRTRAKVDIIANAITAAGGQAEVAVLDVYDAPAVNAHADAVAAQAGRIDVMFNGIGVTHVQGKSFVETPIEEFVDPIAATARAQFIPAQAVARHMVSQGAGVILTLTTPGGRIVGKGFLANGVFSAATEAFSRLIAAELGGAGIRVVTLCPTVLPDALDISGCREVFEGVSKRAGIPVHVMLSEYGRTGTLLGRLPKLQEVAEYAAFLASDRAGATTGAIANINCGSITD